MPIHPLDYFDKLIKKIEDDWEDVAKDLSQELRYIERGSLLNPTITFKRLKNLWTSKENRKKVMRTQLVYEYLRYVKKIELNENEVLSLLLMDAIINSTDDLIDNYENKAIVYGNAVVMLFSFIYMIETSAKFPREIIRSIAEIGKSYLIRMSQIPRIEEEYFKKIKECRTEDEIVQYLGESLRFRGSDIEYFGRMCEVFGKCEKEDVNILIDIRTLQLFYKDLYDLEWDIKNKTKTPLVSAFSKLSREKFEEVTRKVHLRLQSSMKRYDERVREFMNRLEKKFKNVYLK